MHKNDEIRLRHMMDAAQEALTFSRDRSRSDLDQDRMLVHSLVRCIEIIGEAASQVTKETQRQLPDIPWPSMVAMRNRLIHAYFDIDLDRVWDTVTDDLPPLIAVLNDILPGE
jgi:uncharacterized protein with HEPN domain